VDENFATPTRERREGPEAQATAIKTPNTAIQPLPGLTRQSVRLLHNDFSMGARVKPAHDE
jgi:hypothetical protein